MTYFDNGENIKIYNVSWAWWHMAVIPALRRLKQED
jgi:hypothetical protein